MDFDFSVVADEAELPEFVHEKAYPRACGADHFSQRLLTDIRTDRRRIAFLAEIRQQEKKSGEALFARIKQLVDQVFLNPAVSLQQVGDEQLRKLRLIMQHRNHCRLLYCGKQAFLNGGRCCYA